MKSIQEKGSTKALGNTYIHAGIANVQQRSTKWRKWSSLRKQIFFPSMIFLSPLHSSKFPLPCLIFSSSPSRTLAFFPSLCPPPPPSLSHSLCLFPALSLSLSLSLFLSLSLSLSFSLSLSLSLSLSPDLPLFLNSSISPYCPPNTHAHSLSFSLSPWLLRQSNTSLHIFFLFSPTPEQRLCYDHHSCSTCWLERRKLPRGNLIAACTFVIWKSKSVCMQESQTLTSQSFPRSSNTSMHFRILWM